VDRDGPGCLLSTNRSSVEGNYSNFRSEQQLTARIEIKPTGSGAQAIDGMRVVSGIAEERCLRYQLLAAIELG